MITQPLPTAVYVVFGASGGIGSSLSQLLGAQPGAQLLLSGRDEERLQAVSSSAAAGAASVAVAPADPLDVAAVEAVVNEAVKRYGRVDGVANCVGSVLLKSGRGDGVWVSSSGPQDSICMCSRMAWREKL